LDLDYVNLNIQLYNINNSLYYYKRYLGSLNSVNSLAYNIDFIESIRITRIIDDFNACMLNNKNLLYNSLINGMDILGGIINYNYLIIPSILIPIIIGTVKYKVTLGFLKTALNAI
jgi:hypothetical protein